MDSVSAVEGTNGLMLLLRVMIPGKRIVEKKRHKKSCQVYSTAKCNRAFIEKHLVSQRASVLGKLPLSWTAETQGVQGE